MKRVIWKRCGCAKQGRSHLATGAPCQDSVAMLYRRNVSVVALSDGAGSAELSQIGSRICAAKLCEVCCRSFDVIWKMPEEAARASLVRSIRRALVGELPSGYEIGSLASTALVVAVKRNRYIAAHLGDGVIGVKGGDSRGDYLHLLSGPDNGEHSNETTFITSSDAEGAGQMFTVTTLDMNKLPIAKDGSVDYSKDFFGKHTSLTVSGQLEGELGALALGGIYTFGPTFRAENSNTPRHLAEFWMVEPEVAFMDNEGNQDLAEAFTKHCLQWALDHCMDDLEFLAEHYDKELIERIRFVVERPFVRITYTEGVAILEEAVRGGKKFEFPVYWGADLASEHERYLVEQHYNAPVIMTDYPKEIKAFYMKQNDDGKTVRGMDVLFPHIGEIIGGSERETDIDKLTARAEEVGIKDKDLWWYLDTRRYGSAPHAGFGLGFERLLLFVTGMTNIRDVIPFPRTPNNANF